jgi:hypothetical protein
VRSEMQRWAHQVTGKLPSQTLLELERHCTASMPQWSPTFSETLLVWEHRH